MSMTMNECIVKKEEVENLIERMSHIKVFMNSLDIRHLDEKSKARFDRDNEILDLNMNIAKLW